MARGGQRPHRLELNYHHSLLIINNKLHTETVMLLSSKTLATLTKLIALKLTNNRGYHQY